MWSLPEIQNKANFVTRKILNHHYAFTSIKSKNLPVIKTCQDLSGYSIVGILGYYYTDIDNLSKTCNFTVLRAKSHRQAIKMLRSSRVDYYLGSPQRALWAINDLQLEQGLFRYDTQQSFFPDSDISLMMDKNIDENIQATIQRKVESMYQDGSLKKIIDQYTPNSDNL